MMGPISDEDNICPNTVVSSSVPHTKDFTGMDQAEQDQCAAEEYAQKVARLQTKIDTAVRNYLTPAVEKAQKLQANIEELGKHCDDNTLALYQEYDAVMDEVERLYDYLYSIVASALDWRYSTAEVKSWFERAVAMGCDRPRMGRVRLGDLLYLRTIPNAPFREHIEARLDAGGSVPGIGDTPLPDPNFARDVLKGDSLSCVVGIRPRGNGSLCLWISYEQGVALANLLNMTPQAAGI